MLRTLSKKTLLSSVTTTGAGSSFSVERSKGWTFVIASSSVTTGGTVDIEAYIGGAWYVVHSESVIANGAVICLYNSYHLVPVVVYPFLSYPRSTEKH